MKEIIKEKKMYAGYPVFLLTYFDTFNNRYNFATISSMYVLGEMVVIGFGKNNARFCIHETKNFSVSFLSQEYIEDMELGGESGRVIDKFAVSNVTLDTIGELRYIKEAELVYDLTFVESLESTEFPKLGNLVCRLNKVYGKDDIVNEGILDIEKYNPTLVIGTDQGSFFKSLK